jgi:hypothetical protein
MPLLPRQEPQKIRAASCSPYNNKALNECFDRAENGFAATLASALQGQTRKSSARAQDFRFTPSTRHLSGHRRATLRATKRDSALVPVIAVAAHTMVARPDRSAARGLAWPYRRRQ